MNFRLFLFVAILFGSTDIVAQINFEPGYFINNSGDTISCFIKNVGWLDNPIEFEYKTSEGASVEKGSAQNCSEFGIHGEFKYRRFTVQIDRSNDRLSELSRSRSPEMSEETLFLRVVVEGKAALFDYEGSGQHRLFYSIDNAPVQQLIFKKYLAANNLVAKNEHYKQQLLNDLHCEKHSPGDVSRLRYTRTNMEKYFIAFNACEGPPVQSHSKRRGAKKIINISLRPGISLSSLSLSNTVYFFSTNLEFNRKPAFRLGTEFEFVLPFYKNKFALIVEPTYQHFYNTEHVPQPYTKLVLIATVKYQSIELPVGIRYYAFLSQRSKMFFNPCLLFDFPMDSNINLDYETYETSYNIKSRINLGLGMGYTFKQRYTMELRYAFNRNLMTKSFYWNSDYDTFSAIVGLRIF